MVGTLTNLNCSVLEKDSGKNLPKSSISVHIKFGPLGSDVEGDSAGSMAKVFPTAAALILMSLVTDAKLDEFTTMTLS